MSLTMLLMEFNKFQTKSCEFYAKNQQNPFGMRNKMLRNKHPAWGIAPSNVTTVFL